jgi:dimethylaniline monooxygenase (N-oxide forming)
MEEKEVRPNCIIYYTRLVSTFLCQNTTNILKSYKQTFSYLHPPLPTSNDANIRNIVSPTHLTLAYIGFERPGVGANPHPQSQNSKQRGGYPSLSPVYPIQPQHYTTISSPARPPESNMASITRLHVHLAKGFGGAPSLLNLWKTHGWRVLLTYCFGLSLVSFYRLIGPFALLVLRKSRVTRSELEETILRRGYLGNSFLGLPIPMVF